MDQGRAAPNRLDRLAWRRPWLTGALLVAATPLAGFYVYLSFTHPNPGARILLRTLPILPLAVWTLWLDPARPFRQAAPLRRLAGRVLLLVAVMALAVGLLGVALNWLYDPSRVF